MADSVVSTLIDQHRLAELRERTARHRPKGYRPPVPLDPIKSGASAADHRAYVSKHAVRYGQAASALAAALKAAAQTNDELAALEPLQEFVPEPVRAWPELNGNRLNEWLDRADAMSNELKLA